MNFMADWGLRTKLLAMAGLISGLGVLGGGFGIYGMLQTESAAEQVAGVEMAGLDNVRAAQVSLIDAGRARARMIVAATAEDRAARKAAFRAQVVALKASLEAAAPAFVTDAGRQALADTRAAYDTWVPQADRFIALLETKPYGAPDAETLQSDALTTDLNGKVNDQLKTLVERRKAGAARSIAASQATFRTMLALVIGATTLALAGGLVVGWFLSRALTRPIARAVEMAQAVAAGDLTQHAKAASRDEAGRLLTALDTMTTNLARLVGDVRIGIDAIATASSQIAQGNNDLSARTEQQAASLQQTAASIDQMSGTVRASSDGARQASDLSAAASQAAAQGGAAVGDVVATMAGIQESSRRITNIIGVIDGIAFQTNILALNAAVEAARAGEQGRGFAVVASEVRSLAQRSAEAAKEIKSLIQASVEQVDAGSTRVGQAGRTIDDAVAQVRKVTALVGEIAHASQEQNQGIGQINTAVGQLDQATQQNAALVEETAAAAESLRLQAGKLAEAMALFRTGSGDKLPVAAAAAPAGAAEPPAPATAAPAAPRRPARAPQAIPATPSTHRPAAPRTTQHAAPARPAAAPLPAPAATAAADDDWTTF